MAVSNNTEIEKRLWEAADELRANSKLKSSKYSVPVLVICMQTIPFCEAGEVFLI